jgi:phosphoribosyl 1,2-cyclic phosphodiesterase
MRYCVIARGSKGNSISVTDGDTGILIDCGISAQRITTNLKELGVDPGALSGLCLTHDHTDHISGLDVAARKWSLPVYATEGTSTSVLVSRLRPKSDLQWMIFTPGNTFTIGSLTVHPFVVPHDAGDPVGFVISNGCKRLGVATDLGYVSDMAQSHLGKCHALVLESNHDVEMLRDANRPWNLKERIAGRHGHLSNYQTQELLEQILPGQLSTLVLAHLSEECNNPALVRNTTLDLLGRLGLSERVTLHIASQTDCSPLFAV